MNQKEKTERYFKILNDLNEVLIKHGICIESSYNSSEGSFVNVYDADSNEVLLEYSDFLDTYSVEEDIKALKKYVEEEDDN